MVRMRSPLAGAALLLLLAGAFCSGESKEERTGRELAKEVERDAKLVTDSATVARVSRIGQALAAVAKRDEVRATYGWSQPADFSYQFKILDCDDINALSLPGGIIYIYRGLLEFTESDDELAGVIAHEVAHAAHHHFAALEKKQSKMDLVVGLIAIAGSLSKLRGDDLANLVYGAQSVGVARLSGYGREAEFDADRTSVVYAQKAGFDPRGILRFLGRLNSYQEQHGEMRNLGIFQTHPPSEERSVRIAEELAAMGVEIDLREAAHLATAQVEPTRIGNKEFWTVKLAGKLVCTMADADGLTSRDRAEKTKAAINSLLKGGLNPMDLKTRPARGELVARDGVILSVTPADSAVSGLPAEEILAQAVQAIRYALWSDWIKTGRRG